MKKMMSMKKTTPFGAILFSAVASLLVPGLAAAQPLSASASAPSSAAAESGAPPSSLAAEMKDLVPGDTFAPCTDIHVEPAHGVLFADTFESGNILAWGSGDYSASYALDLDFTVHFPGGLSGEHMLHLRLTTPKGHHYQTLSTPISGASTLQSSTRRVDGFPFPVEVTQLVRHLDGSTSASLTLPVAGTQIVTHSLYGAWRAEAFLDHSQTACGPAQTFGLRP